MAIVIFPSGTIWSQAQRGVELAEAGISIRRFQVRYFPEINERLQDNLGQVIARAISNGFAKEITLEGEVTDFTHGVMLFTLAQACTIANDYKTFHFGADGSPGTLLLDEVTETQERAGWRSINMRLSSNPLLIGTS